MLVSCFYPAVANELLPQYSCLSSIRAKILSGDLVFRRGTGFFSPYFMNAGKFSVPFSHVGIIVIRDKKLIVLHSVASEFTGIGGVRADSFEEFIAPSNSNANAIYRVSAIESQRQKAVEFALNAERRKVPFDTAFNMKDTSKLYCTTLVWRAYKLAGIELVPLKDYVTFGGDTREIISLSNLLNSKYIHELMQLKHTTED